MTSNEANLMAIGANRINIPAIGRIPGGGTAFLVAPGIIMTSTNVLQNKTVASRHEVVFFESGKRDPVTVRLLPQQYYFSCTYPDYLDYCLVACETNHIYGVRPVRLPLHSPEWADVAEKDVCLIVQHPTAGGKEKEEKRFEEVTRVRADILTFRVSDSAVRACGCPVFNDQGQLVGLFHQAESETGDGVVAQAMTVSAIVKHMFALAQLSRIQNNYSFEEVWHTWSVANSNSVDRIVKIIQNFPDVSIAAPALIQLCDLIKNATDTRAMCQEAVQHGGLRSMMEYLSKPSLSAQGLETDPATALLQCLWTISVNVSDDDLFSKDDVKGIVAIMSRQMQRPEVAQYGSVLLFNVVRYVARSSSRDEADAIYRSIIDVAVRMLEAYDSTEVVLKFSVGSLSEIAKVDFPEHIQFMVDTRAIELAVGAISKYPANEYLCEYTVELLSRTSRQHGLIGHPSVRSCVVPLLDAVRRYSTNKVIQTEGNDAVWHLGVDVVNRLKIVSSGGLGVIESSSKYIVTSDTS
eukprot:PhM_4_TR4160/c0_g1_i1/m.61526